MKISSPLEFVYDVWVQIVVAFDRALID
jgi:hypothetical protein